MDGSRLRNDTERAARACIIRGGPGLPPCGMPATRLIEVDVYDDRVDSGLQRRAVPVCREHYAALTAAARDEGSKSA